MKKPTLSSLTKKLDSTFSLYIRLHYADKRGYVKCVSCGRRYHYKIMQAGHYVKRSSRQLRWSVRNVFPQCVGCNVFQNGNYPAFTKYLLDNFGEEKLQALIKDGRKIRKWSVPELQTMLEEYQELIKTL